jgi:hypothetical protein
MYASDTTTSRPDRTAASAGLRVEVTPQYPGGHTPAFRDAAGDHGLAPITGRLIRSHAELQYRYYP